MYSGACRRGDCNLKYTGELVHRMGGLIPHFRPSHRLIPAFPQMPASDRLSLVKRPLDVRGYGEASSPSAACGLEDDCCSEETLQVAESAGLLGGHGYGHRVAVEVVRCGLEVVQQD